MKTITESQKNMDDLELFKRRLEIMEGAKLRETDRINAAIKVQDTIRAKVGKWDGSREIRKWREAQ